MKKKEEALGKVPKKSDKRGMEIEMLTWWIIGFVVLVVVVLSIIILRGKGVSALDFVKNLFRFRT